MHPSYVLNFQRLLSKFFWSLYLTIQVVRL
uniref:ACA1 n=1 Tax=Arundo donax TaxID=35708 RepID=A0A0A9A9B5_ARUDO